eukprot:47658_1
MAAKHVSNARVQSMKRMAGMQFRASSFLLKFAMPLILLLSPTSICAMQGRQDAKDAVIKFAEACGLKMDDSDLPLYQFVPPALYSIETHLSSQKAATERQAGEKDARIHQLTAENEEKFRTINELNDELEQLKDAYAKLTKTLGEKDERIKTLTTGNEQKAGDVISKLTEEGKVKDDQIEQLNT